MKARTVRIRPVRSDTLNQHRIVLADGERDGTVEISLVGDIVAVAVFVDAGLKEIRWIDDSLRPAAKQVIKALALAYGGVMVHINGR